MFIYILVLVIWSKLSTGVVVLSVGLVGLVLSVGLVGLVLSVGLVN